MTPPQIRIILLLVNLLFFAILNSYGYQISSFNVFAPYIYMLFSCSSIIFFIFILSKLINVRFYKIFIFFILIEVFLQIFTISIFPKIKPHLNSIRFQISNTIKTPIVTKAISSLLNFVQNVSTSIAMGGSVQFYSDLSKYDSDLFYTLRPNTKGTFSGSIEYKNPFEINSLGVRDDEKSLNNPEIIFLGDSHTLGYGVTHEESYPEIVGKNLNRNVLNTGIPSYGTAREYLFLKRLPLDSCKLLVIQYCSNDKEENNAFVKNNFFYIPPSKSTYEEVVSYNKTVRYYYPFKNIHTLIDTFLYAVKDFFPNKRGKNTNNPLSEESNDGVKIFYLIINKIREYYPGNILIIHVDDYGKEYYTIGKKLENYLLTYPQKNMYYFDTQKALKGLSRYQLIYDSHNNAEGYRVVGDSLSVFIKKRNLLN